MSAAVPSRGKVYLVGAGPGSLGLATLRARQLIEQAEVLVYDFLVNADMLKWAQPGIEIIYAGKSGSAHTLTQDQINALLINRAREGKIVVRLKGGDPYVFGRGGEEAQELVAAQIAFEVVPGVTSAIAAPAYAGIPVTHRDHASMVTFVTGHEDPTKPDSALDWRQLAQLKGTKIFLMGVERIRAITSRLISECADPTTPVALVRWGTTTRQESVEGTLSTIADIVEARQFKAPAITVIGSVVNLRRELNWYEALPLFGQRVVVTRTRQQASGLSERLRLLGADVLEIPTIRITGERLSEEQCRELPELAEKYDWMIFTSPNGVDHFFNAYLDQVGDIRHLGAIQLAAVGPATRKRLEAYHLKVALQPCSYTARDLAQAFPQKAIPGHRFLIIQGNLAEPTLEDHLSKQGGKVSCFTVYRTDQETEDITGAQSRYQKEGAHWITFTSSSTAENWLKLALQTVPEAPQPKVISMGPITSETLHRNSIPIAASSSHATIDSLVETLVNLCKNTPC